MTSPAGGRRAPANRAGVAALALGIALLTALPFLPTLQNGFVTWDDDKNFLTNPAYRGLGWEQLQWMWSTFHLGHYVPLSWMTLGLDYSLWGMDARGYHLTSLVIHAANAVVVYLLARRLLSLVAAQHTSRVAVALGAAFAALWFAVHPLRVESVAWVTERRDVLSGLLYSTTVLLYLGSVSGERVDRRRYWASVAVFALALLSKATAMTLPAVLLLLNVQPLRRLAWKRSSDAARTVLIELIPFAVLSAGAMLLSIIALSPGEQLAFADKLAVSAWGLFFYLWKSLVPTGLAAYYPLPGNLRAGAPMFLIGYAAVIALAALGWRFWRRAPGAVVAMAAFVVIVLPMLGVVQNGPQLSADRYTYHAAPALALLAGGLFVAAWQWQRIVAGAVAVALLVTLGALTWRQTMFWRDSWTLWSRVLEVSDDAAIAHNALGNLLLDQDRISEALGHYERAVRLDPDLAAAHDNLGVTLVRLGRPSEAVPHFERAVAYKDEAAEAYSNWGVALMALGNVREAIERYRLAVAADSLNASAESNWGSALARVNALEDAIPHFRNATRIQPRLAQAHANLGAVLARLGRWNEAADELGLALILDPSDADTRESLRLVRQELVQGAPSRAPTGRTP